MVGRRERERVANERVAVLEEMDSFLAAVITDPVTIGNDWVTFSTFEGGPHNFEDMDPDFSVAEDGSGLVVGQPGIYFAAANFHLSDPTASGELEAAIQPLGECTPIWPDDSLNKGHQSHWVNDAVFGWTNSTPGYSPAPVLVTCLAGDVITPTIKFISASGTATVDVRVLMYAQLVKKRASP